MASAGRVRWVLVAWLFVLSAVAYIDRVNMSVAGTELARNYGLSLAQLGLLASALLAGYALCQAPAGRIADRYGARRVLTLGLLLWAVFSVLTASVPRGAAAFLLLLAIRFGLGATEAVMYPASNRIVANWIPVGERGLANGLIFMGVGVGAGITSPLITFIMVRAGWRTAFLACAALGSAAAVVWYAIARDRPSEHPSVSPAERAYIGAGSGQRLRPLTALPWRVILRDRNVMCLTASYFCYGYSAWVFLAWFFIYLNTVRGMDLRSSALYGALPGLGMAMGSALGGFANDRLCRLYGRRIGRCGVAIAGIGSAAVFIATGALTSSTPMAALVLAGGAGALYIAQSSFWSVSADIAGPSAGAVSGVMNMGAQIGGMLTAWLTPRIGKQFGWSTSFLVAAALCVLGAALWSVVDPERSIGDDQRAEAQLLAVTP
jgi:ACS family glucarate transporter-like MFS transporter